MLRLAVMAGSTHVALTLREGFGRFLPWFGISMPVDYMVTADDNNVGITPQGVFRQVSTLVRCIDACWFDGGSRPQYRLAHSAGGFRQVSPYNPVSRCPCLCFSVAGCTKGFPAL